MPVQYDTKVSFYFTYFDEFAVSIFGQQLLRYYRDLAQKAGPYHDLDDFKRRNRGRVRATIEDVDTVVDLVGFPGRKESCLPVVLVDLEVHGC